ncbi:MAG TPA: DnaA/Hda family protein, partial [Elusimicrobiota bacterium]|nr:DnaA/Hda family protein [Elusimicrobiota bacterium]
MYNPLFLYGVPGTGKSHMINAIGSSLSKGLGGAVLLSTSGSRLSRAVNAALARKALAEIDDRVVKSKALLMDDIHLLAVSDQNKDALAKVFKSFFDRKQQVVITSLYPPKSLGALEEALKFSFSKGWSVDLKIPSPTTQKDLISAAAERAHVGLGGDEISLLHEKLSQWGYSDLTLWLKRVAVFKSAREASGQTATAQEALRLLYEPVVAGGTEAPKIPATNFKPPTAPANAEPIAVIVPKGHDGLAAFAAATLYDVGLKNGFTQVFRHVLWETYDPAVPFGVPFMIGEMCYRARVTRALIVGPAPDSPLGPRSAEFAHATRRILESSSVEMAFVPFNGLKLDAHYLNAHLDLTRPLPE